MESGNASPSWPAETCAAGPGGPVRFGIAGRYRDRETTRTGGLFPWTIEGLVRGGRIC